MSFSGLVRDDAAGSTAMELEHYPGMTEKALGGDRGRGAGALGARGLLVIHRYGRLLPGEQIMMVATAAPHRQAAFAAAEFLMDYLKSRAPFWKKEFGPDGAHWVAAQDADEAALGRWR